MAGVTNATAAPSIDVIAPLDETVARPTVHVEATCDGGGGAPCTTVTLLGRVDGAETRTQLGTWQGVSHIELDVSVDDGAIEDLEFHATDAAGNGVMVTRRVYGDTSAALHPVLTVDGPIADATLDRVLYEANGTSWIFHRADCSREMIGGGAAQALTPHGALLATCSGGCALAEWRDGARVEHGPVDPSSLRVAGNYAVWTEGYVPGPLHRLDLASGAETIVAPAATPGSGDVGPDGSVTYSTAGASGHVAHRVSGGVDTALGGGDLSATDGTLAIFTDDDGGCALRLYRGADSEQLSSLCTSPSYLASVRAGWVAFVRPDDAGHRQLWTRSPSGARTQLTTAGCNLAPPLGDDGSVIAQATVGGDAARWLFAAGATPTAITHADPHLVKNVDGHWLVAIGRTLFSVDPAPEVCVPGGATGGGGGNGGPLPDPGNLGDVPGAGGCSATRAPSASWLVVAGAAFLLARPRRRPPRATA
jgi:hypothetical protein